MINCSPVNCTRDYLPLLCYSPEVWYIFTEFLIRLIHWRKQYFSYANLKSLSLVFIDISLFYGIKNNFILPWMLNYALSINFLIQMIDIQLRLLIKYLTATTPTRIYCRFKSDTISVCLPFKETISTNRTAVSGVGRVVTWLSTCHSQTAYISILKYK